MNRQQRFAARLAAKRKGALCNEQDPQFKVFCEAFNQAADNLSIPLGERAKFLRIAIEKLWNDYIDARMNKRIVIENKINGLGIRIPNGTVKKKYYASFALPMEEICDVRADGLEETGLQMTEPEPGTFAISGTPEKRGDFNITISYSTVEGEPRSSFVIPVVFNPNPRDLWNDIRSELDKNGIKKDSEILSIIVEEDSEGHKHKDIIAASVQGRSHAHDGRPRDDFFAAEHYQDSDWYVMAVADGAGSAPQSWKGSEIACNSILKHCREVLKGNMDFEEAIIAYDADKENIELRRNLTSFVSNIIYKGAVRAHEAINALAAADGNKPRDYATTLMFVICKKFSFGWFVASFWVGDGAMAIYNEKEGKVKLLGTPDEGEFSGQTRFLTMREIFQDKDIVQKRMRVAIEPDFTALFMMTDGVSDPLFETDKNLNDTEKWKEFLALLKEGFPEDGIEGVDLRDDNPEAAGQLLKWLGFWRPGNHDDRTLLMLC